MATVTLDNITHRYYGKEGNATIAVEDIKLEINDGEFIVVVGPSGCGKSTTLEILAGLLQPTEGRIHFGKDDVTGSPARKRDVAMVFQSYALYPHMTVRENMAFPLKQRSNLTGAEANNRIDEVAGIMDIQELLDRMPSDLSGGQKQRVSLGRAIVRDPDVFLMDEPLSNLDAKLRREMRIELQELHSELETTTIYVTHNQEEAMTMSDRIVIMNQGEIQQVGAPQEVYDDPTNRFVAEFIGEPSMNFLNGNIKINDGVVTFVLDDHDFAVNFSEYTDASEGSVTLGVRPENIELTNPAAGDIIGDVNLVEPMGPHYEVQVGLTERSVLTAMVDTDTELTEGDSVGVKLDESTVHLFDGKTGERLER